MDYLAHAEVLPLLALLLAAPNTALSQATGSGPMVLAPEARARLEQAAGDSRVAPWQRDLMMRLASAGTTSTLNPPAAGFGAAGAMGAADGAWSPLVGLPRYGHSAIYDPVRDRMVVFGGYSGSYLNDVWVLSLASTPAWTQLTPSGMPPTGRYFHSAIYDPVRDRMLVFGGSSGASGLGDVWALSLAGASTWTQLTPSGSPPSGRCGHSAIYDPLRDRMLVFGGYASASLNDVWALSLASAPSWTQLTPSGTLPARRGYHTAIYDPVRDRMVIFAGNSGSSPYLSNDVWALSLASSPAWAQLTPSGAPPSERWEHSAVYDPIRDRMLVFGGNSDSYFLNDVWALSLAGTPAWTEQTSFGSQWDARLGHSAIYDPVRDRMVVFGGRSSYSGLYLSDAWALSLADTPAWTHLAPTVDLPPRQTGHSAIYDPVRRRMVVCRGDTDLWALSLAGTPAWTQLTPSGTLSSARRNHSAIYDPARDRMVVFGG